MNSIDIIVNIHQQCYSRLPFNHRLHDVDHHRKNAIITLNDVDTSGRLSKAVKLTIDAIAKYRLTDRRMQIHIRMIGYS